MIENLNSESVPITSKRVGASGISLAAFKMVV